MKINIRYFGPAREAVGIEIEEMIVSTGISVAGLRELLLEQHPHFSTLAGASRFAVNMDYALDSDIIPEGAEVAVIPPVAGG
ncbi:MAG: MoaD/ThiS family protein [Ignavibacteriae bacterium]|nr:MoaD/ThiS family protein [Ignavibacteriota bacterium]MCB9215517.1 MoaD/ThiS family protein [Ignavibacteria bacterium]